MAPPFIRPTVAAMLGYTPGEQPAPGERIIKINTNENPFPPSPKVIAAIREIEPEQLRRYPQPLADTFRNTASKIFDLAPDQIIAGNGSDDILAIAIRTFCSPGDTLAVPDPTYSLYPVLSEISEVKFTKVPWEKNWDLPTDALLSARPRAIFLANPNAPSGTFVNPNQLRNLANLFPGLLLIDEAYADFADENCLSLLKDCPNVLITRTFSKGYSLAGLRFGFGLSSSEIIHEMNKIKDSYNCDAISIVAASAAIADQEYAQQSWRHVRAERQRLTTELESLGWNVLPSQANFLLAATPDKNGKAAYLGLKAQGILVRYFDVPGLTDKIRITIGASHENNALISGVKALSAEKAA